MVKETNWQEEFNNTMKIVSELKAENTKLLNRLQVIKVQADVNFLWTRMTSELALF